VKKNSQQAGFSGPESSAGRAIASVASTMRGSPPDNKRMSCIDHLEELRWMLIRCFCAVAVCAIPCGLYWRKIYVWFAIHPLKLSDPIPIIVYTAPAEGVLFSIRIALTSGFLLALPFIFLQLWRFVTPALYKKEKGLVLGLAVSSTICFLGGFFFCYYLLPFIMQFLTGFATEIITPFFRIVEYFSFLLKMSIAFGIAFELPVAAFVLAKLKLIDHNFLLRFFRYIIIGIFILAAILTPPDVLSQIMLALPLIIIYVISILLVYFVRLFEPCTGKKDYI
jgi:sec-independent protein translocase protein TatC